MGYGYGHGHNLLDYKKKANESKQKVNTNSINKKTT